MAAEVKLFTSEVEGRVVDECLKLHGGAGYMDEDKTLRLYRDARIARIHAGTSEIMREIIGLGLDERTCARRELSRAPNAPRLHPQSGKTRDVPSRNHGAGQPGRDDDRRHARGAGRR
ncbi:acyl-CoA dehydrogenase family protein [Mesobacterium pallidum]|uniref:acyl-CoA dehydrogenase family protein n=1 Tax=Mesobacterium pallidum TaxID=2872037 RepID=UPI002342D004|nr:acyl-CoA dehydrogenase family protein [Mesobacterium pallidum]